MQHLKSVSILNHKREKPPATIMATESDDDIESIGEDVIGEDDNDGYETPPEIKSAMDDFQKQANNGIINNNFDKKYSYTLYRTI